MLYLSKKRTLGSDNRLKLNVFKSKLLLCFPDTMHRSTGMGTGSESRVAFGSIMKYRVLAVLLPIDSLVRVIVLIFLDVVTIHLFF